MTFRPPLTEPVPFEIWGTIFKFSCPRLELDSLDKLGEHHLMPITLSHVCTIWREITISRPQFWTEILFVVGHRFGGPGYPNANLMSLFLERSGDSPLFVSLSIHRYNMESDLEVRQFLVALFSNAVRWKMGRFYFSFDEIDSHSWHALLSIIESAPLLESLNLTIANGTDTPANILLPSHLLLRSPILTKLMVLVETAPPFGRGPFSAGWLIQKNIPYRQITHLFLESAPPVSMDWRDIAAVFDTSPNLVSCFLVGIADTDRLLRVGNPIVLKHLRYLYLETSGDNILTPELDWNLTAPSLKTLMLVGADYWEPEPYTQFITRSSCTLEAIIFHVQDMDVDSILECMRLSPTLRTVNALPASCDAIVLKDFFERITEWDTAINEFSICPNLQEMFLQCFVTVAGPDPYIHTTEMLKKRLCPPDGSAGAFTTIVIYPDAPEAALDSLKPLRGDPWRLKVLEDDFEIEGCAGTLWKRYGGE